MTIILWSEVRIIFHIFKSILALRILLFFSYQKKGYGTAAAKLCIDFLYKEYKARRVSAPVNQCHTAAQKFWAKLGFAYSDSVEDGYVFMRLNLVYQIRKITMILSSTLIPPN